jgi:hypothetical protein
MNEVQVAFGESAPVENWMGKGTLKAAVVAAMTKWMQEVLKQVAAKSKDWKWGKVGVNKSAFQVYMEGSSETAWMTVSLIGNERDVSVNAMMDCGDKTPGKRSARDAASFVSMDNVSTAAEVMLRVMGNLKDSVVF